MNHFKLRNAFVIGTLASAMAIATTGCSDSDDRGGMMDSGSDDRGSMNTGSNDRGMDGSNSDTRIVADIQADLQADRSLSGSASDIDVTINNGVVTLSGEVADAAAKSAAERAARNADGVQSVRNNLTLSRAGATSGMQRETGARADGGRDAGDRTGTLAGTGNDYENDAGMDSDTQGDAMSDTWITTKVKAELLSDDLSSGFDVGVETVDGWVTLSGQLGNHEAVDHIRNLVENVDGVRGVDISNLSVVAST